VNWRSPLTRLEARLLALSGVLHVGIGLAEAFSNEPMEHRASAWQILYRTVPFSLEVWPLLWVVVGVMLTFGAWHVRTARVGAFASAFLFAVWAVGSYLSWTWGYGATLSMSIALSYMVMIQLTAGLLVSSARVSLLLQHRLQDQIAAMGTRIERLEARLRRQAE
jgi:hypothetical protein